MSDHIEAPQVILDNDDPPLHEDNVRAFLDAENDAESDCIRRGSDSR
jgi:hypothetical protein